MKNLYPSLVLCILSLVQACQSSILRLTVFYEWKDPKSLSFFQQKLGKTYKIDLISKVADVELVPFGTCHLPATQGANDTVHCPRGDIVYLGNAIQSCYFDTHPLKSEQVAFSVCMMKGTDYSNPFLKGHLCFDSVKSAARVTYDDVRECSKTKKGANLQKIAGQRTTQVISQVSSVPVFLFNNNYDMTRQYERRACGSLTESIMLYVLDFCLGIRGDVTDNTEKDKNTKRLCKDLKKVRPDLKEAEKNLKKKGRVQLLQSPACPL